MSRTPPLLDKEFNEHDPKSQILILGERVTNLGKEKEKIERDHEKDMAKLEETHEKDIAALTLRVVALEKSYQRGAGALLVLPFLGTAIGLVLAYGKTLLRPWTGDHSP